MSTMKAARDMFLLAMACAVIGLSQAGCGGGAAANTHGTGGASTSANGAVTGEVVASVDGKAITESTLDHWIALQAAAQYEVTPKAPLPAGVVPDPPAFRGCIAYLRSVAQHETAAKARTNAELLSECQAGYRRLRTHALEILITFKWFEAEASRLGVKVPNATVEKAFKRVFKEQFHSPGEYQVYLRRSEQTLADEYQRLRIDLLSSALQQHFFAEGTSAVARYYHEFPRVWAAKTSCRSSDVNPNCREYTGSGAPQARI